MNSDEFEKRLEQQKIRPIPGEWRREILNTANAASLESRTAKPESLSWWRELLWPCPQAWAGIAAVWLVIFVLNFTTQKAEPKLAKSEPVTPQTIAALKEQRRLYLELAGLQVKEVAEPPKNHVPGPSSQRKIEFQIV